MRKFAPLTAVAALSASFLIAAPSQAMTPGSAAGVKGAAATLDPVEKTACWRYGVYGWAWYPCYSGVDPGYAYRYWGNGLRWGWGYRRWGWGHHW